MRRFLLILFVLGIFLLLSWLNNNKLQNRFPVLKRIDSTLTIVAWVLLIASGLTLLHWLYTQFFK